MLDELIRRHAEPAIGLLERLVAIDTSNPPGRGYDACIAVLRQHLESIGFRCQELPVPGGPAEWPRTVLRAESGHGADAFYLHGHYDVVPAAAEMFVPRRRGGRLSGRGSSDMKGGIVAALLAAQALREAGTPLGGRLVLHLVPDEETGGRLGAEWLAGQDLIDAGARGMLLPEPTGGVVWNAHRGALSMMVRVRGRAAHVGLPQAGRNAVLAAVPLLQAAARLAREMGEAEDPEARSSLVIGGRVDGPSAANAVPAAFAFSLDCRFPAADEIDRVAWRIEEALEHGAAGAVEYAVEVFQRAAPSAVPADCDLGTTLAAHIARATGQPARFETCPGVLETRFYTRHGVPAMAYGPGILEVSHRPDEYVLIEDVLRGAEVMAATIATICAR